MTASSPITRPDCGVIPAWPIGHASVIASSHHHLPRRGVVASRLRDIQLPCLWALGHAYSFRVNHGLGLPLVVITSSRRARVLAT
jgi:hypothetical protein